MKILNIIITVYFNIKDLLMLILYYHFDYKINNKKLYVHNHQQNI